MARVLSDKAIQQLIKKTQKAVANLPKKERHIDDTILRSDEADNQEELDAQFAHMRRREF